MHENSIKLAPRKPNIIYYINKLLNLNKLKIEWLRTFQIILKVRKKASIKSLRSISF